MRLMAIDVDQSLELPSDTGSIVFFDPERMAHRVERQPGDWWRSTEAQREDTREGRLLVVGVEDTDTYRIRVTTGAPSKDEVQQRVGSAVGWVEIESGQMHVSDHPPGAGKRSAARDEQCISLPAGCYRLQLHALKDRGLVVCLHPMDPNDTLPEQGQELLPWKG